MSPTHRAAAGPADGDGARGTWDADVPTRTPPVTARVSDSLGSPAPNALDSLVDDLARRQASQAEPEPDTVEEDPTDERPDPPLLGEELETALGFLEFLRATILVKCEDLSDDDAAAAPLGSLTSAIGIVRHLADVERYWFREVVAGLSSEDAGYRWWDVSEGGDPDAEFRIERGASLAETLEDYRAACESSRRALVGHGAGDEARGIRRPRTVRWVVIHMIEETARHAGHLDAVIELVTGRTGE